MAAIRSLDTAGAKTRGQGEVEKALLTRGHRRSAAAMLLTALRTANVHEDPKLWGPIIAALKIGAQDADDPRGAARCAAVLAQLRGQNIDVLKHLDKNDRLDDGQPTENVRVFTLEVDRRG